MNKTNILAFLNSTGTLFVQIFCPIFGVIAQECYQVLKNEAYKFKKILPKLVLAWFVCLVCGTLIEQSDFLIKVYPILILVIAFSYRKAADWIANDFFQFLLDYLNKFNNKKHD